MNIRWKSSFAVAALGMSLLAAPAWAQKDAAGSSTYEPTVGQAGKDVVWVPTSQALVDRMLDMAKLTPADRLVDLGSGDGRTVITAAKRGAVARGIEYNPDLVALSRRNAAAEGVSKRATFEHADIFKSKFSNATVVTLFLLPELNARLSLNLVRAWCSGWVGGRVLYTGKQWCRTSCRSPAPGRSTRRWRSGP